MNQLRGDAVLAAEAPAPAVHPLHGYCAAVEGSGTSFQEIFA
jgi:hypothetical protein